MSINFLYIFEATGEKGTGYIVTPLGKAIRTTAPKILR
jgi:hypothetical protein